MLLFLVSLYGVSGMFVNRNWILQFPFWISVASLGFILPQALKSRAINESVLLSSGAIPGYNQYILMTLLCVCASILGYGKPKGKSVHKTLSLSREKITILRNSGIYLMLLAFIGHSGLASLTGGLLGFYTAESGNYTLEWSGLPVIYIFFVRLIYPAFFMLLLVLMNEKKIINWILVVLSSLIPIANVVFLGRRSYTIVLVLYVLIGLYFLYNWLPNRFVILVSIFIGGIFILVAPEYRKYSQLGGENEKIFQINLSNQLDNNPIEFEVARKIVYAHDQLFQFGFGSVFYNKIVKSFLPTIFVSREFKESLFIKMFDIDELCYETVHWKRSSLHYVTSTGVTQVFQEFWYFGCLCYFFLGRFFSKLWYSAKEKTASLIFLGVLSPFISIYLTNEFTLFIYFFVYYTIFLYPTFYLLNRIDSRFADFKTRKIN